MTRSEFKELMEKLDVPNTVLARCAGLYDTTICAYVAGRSVSQTNINKMQLTLAVLADWCSTLPFPPSWKDADRVREALGEHRVKQVREKGSRAADGWNVGTQELGMPSTLGKASKKHPDWKVVLKT